MNLSLTAEQTYAREEFRDFTKRVVKPEASVSDKEERISLNVLKMLGKKGYLGSMLPVEYGGMGMDMITIGILNEEVGAGCSSTRSLLTVQGMVALAILKWGNEHQKSCWLPKLASGEVIGAFGLTEPEVGSDAKSIGSDAILDGDSYLLNGTKKWITFGQIADVFLIFAKCGGKPTAFIVPKNSPGLEIKPISGLMGMRASMGAELHMVNCRIPKENVLGGIGIGISHVALYSLDYGRYTTAWGCVGIGQACLEESVRYASERKQFGSYLKQFQLIQKMITEMTVQVKAARLMCYHAGYLKDIKESDSIMETWNAKYFASKMLQQATADGIQIHGANGCSNEYPIERYFRDAKIMEIIEGTSQIHELLIAASTANQYN